MDRFGTVVALFSNVNRSLLSVRCALFSLLAGFAACSAGAPDAGSEPGDDDGSSPGALGDGEGGGDIGGFDPTLQAPPNCGDGNLNEGEEACDDGNQEDGDGCQANCLGVESGFICREAGEPCEPFARCGDGVVAFPEQCDDSNLERGDGCSPTCRVELGFKCDGGICSPTVCGDGVVEGAETCDNGPDDPDDSCSPTCVGEPNCSGGACSSSCGDGVVIGEACDDGNLLDGDGCSSTCEVEPGYDCSAEAECETDDNGNCILKIPAVFRDFDMSTHPDFHPNSDLVGGDGCDVDAVVQGRVEDQLDSSGKPVSTGNVRCSEDLNSWYVDGPNNVRYVGEITLFDNDEGGFVNRWGQNGEQWSYTADGASPRVGNPAFVDCVDDGCVPCPWNAEEGCDGTFVELDGTPFFFPVDGIEGALDGGGFEAKVGPAYGPYHGWPTESSVLGGEPILHNFHFTTEVTYWFPFEADTNATLDFTGDDDVWVFVNGKLAVDLGNTHAPENGSVMLTGSTVSVAYDVADGTVTPFSVPASDFGLAPGNIYEIKVFHAERKRDGSSFRLTLDGFNATRSECVPNCGDGIIGYGEECDDGENNGGYNACQADCNLGAYCGDGIQQENEACDDADPNAPGNCSGCSIVTVR